MYNVWYNPLYKVFIGSLIPASVGKMKLLNEVGVRETVLKSSARISASRTDCIRENYVKHVIEMNEEKYCDKMRFSTSKRSPRVKMRSLSPTTNDDDPNSDSSEELQYGPGIVNKLKTKYMSMTLRDNQKKHARPSLSNMRKASSLDNLLDEELLGDDKTYQISSVISCVNKIEYSKNIAGSCKTVNACADLKRARSMETLQEDKTSNIPNNKSVLVSKTKFTKESKLPAIYDNGLSIPLDSIVNEDVIIVENSTSEAKTEEKRRHFSKNKELPPPDVVRETLKIFENCHKKQSTKSWKSSKADGSPVKSNVKKSIGGGKPALYPKPVVNSVEPKKYVKKSPAIVSVENGYDVKKPLTNGNVYDTHTSTVPSIKANSKTKQTELNHTLSHTTSVHTNKNSINVNVKNSQIVASGVVPVNESVKKSPLDERLPKVNDIDAPKTQFNGECKHGRPEILKPLDTLPVRQVGIIRPLLSSKTSPTLTPQEIQKNFINTKKNLDSKLNGENEKPRENVVVSPLREDGVCDNLSNDVNKPSTLWFNKPWNQQQNTMVFNFKDRKEVPDYIENDGLLLPPNRDRAKKILQEGGGTGYIILSIENGVDNNVNESSTDSPDISCTEEWQLISGPPSPCNVQFEGDNVVINGKSNLRKYPKEKKLRIQFNNTSTTFEYPSEASLLEDEFQNISISEDEPSFSSPELVIVPCSSPKVPSPLNGSNLASYIPSKLSMGDSFELGVTKTNCSSAVNSKQSLQNGNVNQLDNSDYLKPAAENDNVAWSEESIPDLLF